MAIKQNLTRTILEKFNSTPVTTSTLIPDAKQTGLYARKEPGMTSASFYVRKEAKRGGKRKVFSDTLGPVLVHDLEEAREWAREFVASVNRGEDPKVKRQQIEKEQARTFAWMVDEYEAFHKDPHLSAMAERTREENVRFFRLHAVPLIGSKPIHEIDRENIIEVLRAAMATAKAKGKKGAASYNRGRRVLSAIFGWAYEQGKFKGVNPVLATAPVPEDPEQKVLTMQEIARLWLLTRHRTTALACIVQWCLITGGRKGEPAGMRWDEIDWEANTWTLPASRSKNHRENVLPLTPEMRKILEKRRRDYPRGNMVFGERDDCPFQGWGNKEDQIRMAGWNFRNIRTSVDTYLHERGVAPHIVRAITNHVGEDKEKKVQGRYNKAQYLDEKRAVLPVWEKAIMDEVQKLWPHLSVVAA